MEEITANIEVEEVSVKANIDSVYVKVQSDWQQDDPTKEDYIKNKPTIPSKTSELTNDSGFITNEVDNLTNYRTSANQDTIDFALEGRIEATEEGIESLETTKQDTIEDLETIRQNASSGKSASDTIATYGNIVTHNANEFATSEQGAKADSAVQPEALNSYSLISETGNKIDLVLDETDYKITAKLYDKNGTLISTSSVIDLPVESLVISVAFDSATNELVITLKNGNVTRVPLGAIISGLATQTYVDEAISGEDTSVKEWANARFLTEHQSLSEYRKSAYQDVIDENKVDKVEGKGLSTNDFTDSYKNQIDTNKTNIETLQGLCLSVVDGAINITYEGE